MSKQDLILLYGGRSAEREVSVLSAESVMRAIDYQAFSVQTYFITQSGDFIQTQAFEEKPADDEKLMTNDTVDWSKKVAPSAIYKEGAVVFPVLHGPMGEQRFTRKEQWSFQCFMDQWVKMVLFKAF